MLTGGITCFFLCVRGNVSSNSLSDFFRIGFLAHDDGATWSPQRLVRGGGDHIRKRKRTRMNAADYQAGDMRYIGHRNGANFIGDGFERLKIE